MFLKVLKFAGVVGGPIIEHWFSLVDHWPLVILAYADASWDSEVFLLRFGMMFCRQSLGWSMSYELHRSCRFLYRIRVVVFQLAPRRCVLSSWPGEMQAIVAHC